MLTTGDVFAGYAIERQLGRGGMGSVYLARHPRLPRQTALKLLNPELFADNEIRARFVREADLAAQLEHPNIVTVYDRGIDDGRLWISMQFVDGMDAATIAHPVPAERALRIIEGTAAALDHAHRNGVLHRDVKPANILLADADGRERVLLTDFGIARPRDDVHHLTQTGSFTATLAYAAPEQLTGAHLDHRADQYALACTMYALLTGAAPFDATNPVMVIQGHLQSPPPPLRGRRPDLPAALDAVLARALAKRPSDRFDSCAAFAAAAHRALSGTGAQPTVFNSGRSMQQFPHANPVGYARSGPRQQNPRNAGPPFDRPMPQRPVAAQTRSWGVGKFVAAAVVGVLVVGVGAWAWQDERTVVAELLSRTPGHKNLDALSDAFPQMLPSGSGDGVGFEGRECGAYREKERYQPYWMQTFEGFSAKWHCEELLPGRTNYAFFVYPSVAESADVVARFVGETDDRGQSVSGTRLDRQRARKSPELDIYSGSAVVSTFSDPGRECWVLLFYRDGEGPHQADMRDTIEPILRNDLARFPLT
ncbi:serine/threonine-protein kinase [Nocardia salmonicida]|uniref:serine/threonine-protein kinase n=1 Tax=Nocardia salmonicida TaxID=53431 RepID=UPI00379C302C